MIIYRNCFAGLNVHSILSSNNFFYIEHANKAGSFRIFAPYNDAKDGNYAFQKDLGKILNENFNGSWRWHHVVAGEHLRKLFPLHTAAKLYDEEVPTVLVHQDSEHIDFNLLQAHGVHEVFNLPKDKTVLTGKDRKEYMDKLKRLYTTVYEHDNVLNTIAANIFSLM